jgi:hypothetical protein
VQGTDWCFVSCDDHSASPACLPVGATSKCIAIAPASTCRANPGETYSADYLGRVPESGCTTRQQCADELGGAAQDWGCYIEPAQTVGTCVCCAPGSSTPECQ